MDRPAPITEAVRACIQHGATEAFKAISLGYFSLGQQRKVTRPPAGGRNARRVGGPIAATRETEGPE